MPVPRPDRARALRALAVLAATLAACGPLGPKQGAVAPPAPTPPGTPVGTPVTATVGPDGGTLRSADGAVVVTVPAGAVAASTDFTVQELTNPAPHAVGPAWRLGPEGTRFATPVTITLRVDDPAANLPDLSVAYQDAEGYWVHAQGTVVDAAARTLSVPSTHFSDWTLVTTPSSRDLSGSFTLTQTVGVPFTASGTATLSYAGSNTYETFYMVPGTITLGSVSLSGQTCTAATPTVSLTDQLAEMPSSPAALWWGINAYWDLQCTSTTTGVTSSNLASTQFDTYGINLIGCTRGYVGTPVAGPSKAAGTYTIDCGTNGTSTATWDFEAAACGTACTPTNPCDVGTTDCTSGTATCADTGTAVANGTSCGTNAVCDAGVCNACTQGAACTPANVCDAGTTDCSTGVAVCTDTGTPLANGTSCGTGSVCYNGACNACTQGAACTPANACDVGTTDCSTGVAVCTDTGTPVANGTSCGTNLVCDAGACTACVAGAACTPANACDVGTTSCATGVQTCTDTGTPVANGTSCGTNLVCDAGACTACVAGAACTPANACDVGTTSCATGVQTCTDTGTPVANGTACAGGVCGGGTCNACTQGAACTPANACDVGTMDCTTGTPTCTDTGTPVANGTACTGGVCGGGVCNACTQGAACTPTNPCDVGTTDCSSGTPVCTDTLTPVPDGTSCGTGLVCTAGVCG